MSDLLLWGGEEYEAHRPVDETRAYGDLLERIRVLQVERVYRMNMEMIELKFEIGREVVVSGLYRPKEYGASLVTSIARDLGLKKPVLYQMIQFYTTVEEEAGGDMERWFTQQGFDKRISWNRIRACLHKSNPDKPELVDDRPRITVAVANQRVALYSRRRIGQVWTEADHNRIEVLMQTDYGVGKKPDWGDAQGDQKGIKY